MRLRNHTQIFLSAALLALLAGPVAPSFAGDAWTRQAELAFYSQALTAPNPLVRTAAVSALAAMPEGYEVLLTALRTQPDSDLAVSIATDLARYPLSEARCRDLYVLAYNLEQGNTATGATIASTLRRAVAKALPDTFKFAELAALSAAMGGTNGYWSEESLQQAQALQQRLPREQLYRLVPLLCDQIVGNRVSNVRRALDLLASITRKPHGLPVNATLEQLRAAVEPYRELYYTELKKNTPALDDAAVNDPLGLKLPRRPMLGIQMRAPGPDRFQAGERPAFGGVEILSVYDGTCAQAMHLQPRDLLLELNGKPVHTVHQVYCHVARSKVGDAITVKIERDGVISECKGTLAGWTADAPRQMASPVREIADGIGRLQAIKAQRPLKDSDLDAGIADWADQIPVPAANDILWDMHTHQQYLKDYEKLLARVAAGNDNADFLDTTAWVYADHGDPARGVELYEKRLLPLLTPDSVWNRRRASFDKAYAELKALAAPKESK